MRSRRPPRPVAADGPPLGRAAGRRAGAGDAPVLRRADDAVAEAVTGFHVHRGALASLERRPLPPPSTRCWPAPAGSSVCEDIVDHTTSGRSSGARRRSGWTPWSSRRAAPTRCTGGRSRCRWARCSRSRTPGWPTGAADCRVLRRPGFGLLALTPDQSGHADRRGDAGGAGALLLGAEGDGLSSRWLREADDRVCIPMARRDGAAASTPSTWSPPPRSPATS